MDHLIIHMPIDDKTLQWATEHYPELIIQDFSQKRNNYLLLSRALLHDALKNYFDIQDALQIDHLKHGKPYLVDHPSIHFNISHTNHNMAIIIAKNSEVGIDIETIRERKNLQGLIERTLKENEIEWLNKEANQLSSFFKLWSAKEAYLKTTGTGLVGLSGLTLDLVNRLALGPIKSGYLYLKDNTKKESFAFYSPAKVSPKLYRFNGENFTEEHYDWQILECCNLNL